VRVTLGVKLWKRLSHDQLGWPPRNYVLEGQAHHMPRQQILGFMLHHFPAHFISDFERECLKIGLSLAFYFSPLLNYVLLALLPGFSEDEIGLSVGLELEWNPSRCFSVLFYLQK